MGLRLNARFLKHTVRAKKTKDDDEDDSDGEEVSTEPKEDGPLSAFIFKTISDPYTGKISIFRIFSGGINGDATVYNSSKSSREKLGHLHRMIGKKQVPLSPAGCSDIVADYPVGPVTDPTGPTLDTGGGF